MLIIPSIDIYNGKVVRLKKGDYNEVTVYNNSPLKQAAEFESKGIKRIHIVDLGGSKDGTFYVEDIIKDIKNETGLQIQLGGGIRKLEDVKKLNETGVDFFVIGSLSVINKPELEKIVKEFGPDKIIVAADVKDNKISIKGWTEQTDINLYDHIGYCNSLGIEQYLCTDINRDGLLQGTNIKMYAALKEKYPSVFVIASGGLTNTGEITELHKKNIDAAILGKAYYEGLIKIEDLKNIVK